MGYPAPDNVSGVTDYLWYLVCIPDDTAYREAALEAYTNLSNPWAWGLESEHEDSETIEQQWLTAINLTLEIFGMNPLDTIIGHIDDVETLLQQIRSINQACCSAPTGVDVGIPGTHPNLTDGDDIEDEVGTVPAYHGETATSTWADWLELKCSAAALIAKVPALVMSNLDLVSDYREESGWSDAVSQILGTLPGIGALVQVAWELFLAIADPLLDWAIDFDTAVSELQGAESLFKCAAFTADGSDEAASAMAAVAQSELSGTAAKLLAAVFPWKMWATSIYTGEYVDVNGDTAYLADSDDYDIDADCTNCMGAPYASGLYFEEPSSALTPHAYDTYPDSLDGVEMYYNTVYKVRGPHPGKFNFRLDDHAGEPHNDAIIHVLHTIPDDAQICSECNTNPRLTFFTNASYPSASETVSDTVCDADYQGIHTASDVQYFCCGCNLSTTKGWLEFWIEEA